MMLSASGTGQERGILQLLVMSTAQREQVDEASGSFSEATDVG